ncbi:MAG: hypothetical protein OTJ97_09375, partial [SAR202 cluster bacterium]|nr:hypothetical protein [SAR202 cluster bacterium]
VHEAADMGAHHLGHAISLIIDPGVYGAHQRTEPISERVATSDERAPLARMKRAKRVRPTLMAALRPAKRQVEMPTFIHIPP